MTLGVEELHEAYGVESVEISTIAHATDDLMKVQAALHSLLPEPLKERGIFTRRYLQGHYGNPIATFDAKLTRAIEISLFLQHFIGRLSKSEKLLIERDLHLYSDANGNLYVRIDRQQACRGAVELGEDDPIRIKLKFSRLGGNAAGLIKSMLESE